MVKAERIAVNHPLSLPKKIPMIHLPKNVLENYIYLLKINSKIYFTIIFYSISNFLKNPFSHVQLNPIILYLSNMNPNRKTRLQKERKKWAAIFLLCFLMVSVFSQDFSKNSLTKHFLNPLSILKLEQENPIRLLFTKFFSPEIPERFREWR
jgi:hypothetical protein